MSTRSHILCCKISLTLIFYSLWMEGMRRARVCPVNHPRSSGTPARRRQTETARQKDTHTLMGTHTLQSHECLIGRRRAGGRGRELSLRVTLNGGPHSFSGREISALMELLQLNNDNMASQDPVHTRKHAGLLYLHFLCLLPLSDRLVFLSPIFACLS